MTVVQQTETAHLRPDEVGGREHPGRDVPRRPRGAGRRGRFPRRDALDLRPLLALRRPRVGDPEAGRLPGPRRRQPAAGVLARPRWRQAGLLQQLPASRRLGMPRGRGQHQGHELFLPRLELRQHAERSMACPAKTAMARPSTANMGLLPPAKVESYRGFVFACFDPGAVDLRTYLAGAADYIDLVADQAEAMEIVPGVHEYSADANWKLFVENSLDGYHLLPVHVTYFEYLEKFEGTRPNLGGLNEAIDLGNGHAAVACAVRGRGRWPAGRPPLASRTASGSRPRTPSWSANTGRSGPS